MRHRDLLRAMLVDRSAAVHEELVEPFARAGVALSRAADPTEATLLAQREELDSVVINYTMPARVGDRAFLVLRFGEGTARIPVVFLIDRLRWGRRARDAAAEALVPGPWTPGKVLAAVRRVMQPWPCAPLPPTPSEAGGRGSSCPANRGVYERNGAQWA